MALTYEEKIAKLREYEGWFDFTDSQRVFLDGMAKGLNPTASYKVAYPDTRATAVAVALGAMMTRVGIRKALSIIGIDNKTPSFSKKEAMELLTRHLRKTDDPAVLVKLLSIYSKFAGWEEEAEDPGETVDMNKLVEAVEKKRRNTEIES